MGPGRVRHRQPAAVDRARRGRYDLAIADICLEGCIVVPDGKDDPAGTSAVKVADLDGDGEPEILVDVFSGGAHCCLTARLLTFNGTGYTSLDIGYGDVGYVLKDADGDGRPELVGYDPRFSAVFTAFAGSGFPPSVLQVDRGATVDVTRRFPKLIRADAAARLKDLRKAKRGDDVRGILAAYVADEYLLNKGSTGTRSSSASAARASSPRPSSPICSRSSRPGSTASRDLSPSENETARREG